MSDKVDSIGSLLGPKPDFSSNIQGAGAHIAQVDSPLFGTEERHVDLSRVSAFCAQPTTLS